MTKHKNLDVFVSSLNSKKTYVSPHQEFAERSQQLRWFHERTDKELKAMRKGYELMLANQTRTEGAL
jgi:hypothetical protein